MSDDRPAVAIGHVRLHTGNIQVSTEFYERLGMRKCMAWDGMAILELRGGTHLLLIEVDDEMEQILDPVFDLMVEDLEAHKKHLTNLGIESSEISTHSKINHRRFFVVDPDGHRIAIHSDHTDGRTV